MNTITKTKQSVTPKSNTKTIAMVGVFGALAWALMFVKFPVAYLGFLEVELSDIPAIVAGLIFGPLSAVLVELIKNVLHMMQTSTVAVGELANFVVSCGYILPLTLIAKYAKTKKKYLYGFIFGTLGLMITGAILNIFVTVPMYIQVMGGEESLFGFIQGFTPGFLPKLDSVVKIVLLGITPFNLFKGCIISAVGYFAFVKLRGPLTQLSENRR